MFILDDSAPRRLRPMPTFSSVPPTNMPLIVGWSGGWVYHMSDLHEGDWSLRPLTEKRVREGFSRMVQYHYSCLVIGLCD